MGLYNIGYLPKLIDKSAVLGLDLREINVGHALIKNRECIWYIPSGIDELAYIGEEYFNNRNKDFDKLTLVGGDNVRYIHRLFSYLNLKELNFEYFKLKPGMDMSVILDYCSIDNITGMDTLNLNECSRCITDTTINGEMTLTLDINNIGHLISFLIDSTLPKVTLELQNLSSTREINDYDSMLILDNSTIGKLLISKFDADPILPNIDYWACRLKHIITKSTINELDISNMRLFDINGDIDKQLNNLDKLIQCVFWRKVNRIDFKCEYMSTISNLILNETDYNTVKNLYKPFDDIYKYIKVTDIHYR